MIVRTYGRRNRGIARSYSDSGYDDVSESFRDSLTQESPQDIYSFALSSQDSSRWSFDSEPIGSNSSQESRQLSTLHPRKPLICRNLENGDGDFRKSKKARNGKRELEVSKKMKSKGGRSASVLPAKATATATLMETQEFGEMMEHVDEVNFALDGLRKGQPARIRRASLLSLLSICGTAQQRRLLRTHGLAKTIIDAVLGLSFDDSLTNLAAAALFYFLTSDGQDDHLLDSPRCIHFLIKLLTPLTSGAAKAKAPSIGSKLLSLRKDADTFQDISKGADSTSAAIMFKVQELLISCKEMKLDNVNDHGMRKPELSPKWFALLTMEKACLSTISLEDTTGTVRKTGGNFKEKLRELGGLDVVFEIARNCHSILEGWLEQSSSSIQESKDNSDLESLVLLLKCLKIMENATFLSKDNQSHLLGMKAKIDHRDSPWSFTKLIISVIKILSGLSLLKNSSGNSQEDDINLSNGMDHVFEMPLLAYNKVDNDEIFSINSSMRCCSQEQASSQKGLSESQDSQRLSAGRSEHSQPSSETTTTYMADSYLLKTRIYSSTSGSCSGTSRGSNSETPASNSRMNFGLGKRPKVPEETRFELIEDSQDPFAFDEDDFKPSKWDLLSGTQKVSHNKKSRAPYRELQDQCQSHLKLSQQELSNCEVHHSREVSSSAADERKSNLLVECLLAAVKVLMNLTNDNPLGCQQIAACGGLETLASLIANHFPLFGSFLPPVSVLGDSISTFKSSIEVDHQNDRHLSDQELDLLVAILGLLVNLVEKDSSNRSRLASVSVSLRGLEVTEAESRRDVIPLLCSLFLANQGAGEADGEENLLPWDDQAALSIGEKEAEKMIVEAYAALLLAFLSTESKSIRNSIAECLPDHNLAILVPVLERFVEFHMALDMISPETHSAVLEVIESCRLR